MDTQRIALTLLAAALASWALTPAVRALAVRTGAVARPNSRSVHTKPLPYLGGVAIFVAFAAAAVFGLGPRHEIPGVLLLGGGAVLAIGVVDDLRPLPAARKTVLLSLVAVFTVLGGVRIEWVTNPLGGMFDLGLWGIPLTIVWLVVVSNLVNVIDGLDGLAAGISSIVALTLLVACHQAGQAHTVILTAALAGSALGFLPHNFSPAKIIMGDAGALFLGYVIAVVSVEGPIKSATAVALFIPVLALGVPIMDAAFAVWRRTVTNRSVLGADRDHLHHRLLNMGLSQRQAVLLMYSVSGFFGASAVGLTELTPVKAAGVVAGVFSLVYLGARRSGLLRLPRETGSMRLASLSVAATREEPAPMCGQGGPDRVAGPGAAPPVS
ncbi:MAG: MraY family glycosyltransferase [Bacillota bacterium]|nr:MraY family glycosyltransferase [Bacillota bacterium]